MIESVKEKFRQLRLKNCAGNVQSVVDASVRENLSFIELLDRLLDIELEIREKARRDLRYKQSRLGEKLTLDRFDFGHHESRKKHKNRIIKLFDLEFITGRKDVILIGNPGVGKSHLAKSVGYAATQAGIKVVFTTAMDMINQLTAAEAEHTLLKKLQYYKTPDLLICDEIGYLPLGKRGSNVFFQVISARHDKKSTMITTNLPFAEWGNIFDSTSVATAIADRLVYNSEIFILEGKSYRNKK